MSPRPAVVLLDVNETLSDLTPLRTVFADLGLGEATVEPWFAGVLRDGFALTLVGENPDFAALAADAVRRRVRAADGSPEDADVAAERVIGAFLGLAPHPDVVPGLVALAEAGVRIVTFSNGSTGVARALLADTSAAPVVEDYLSVADAGIWKPAAGAYRWACEQLAVDPGDVVMVAVHPWDLEGARRAGLRTAWIARSGGDYPGVFTAPEVTVAGMTELADLWA